MNVEIGAEAALFPEKEYINGIFVTVCQEVIHTVVAAFTQFLEYVQFSIFSYSL